MVNSTSGCDPVSEFTSNSVVLTVTLVCISVALLLVICCFFLCCKYRRLQSQYYEKVELIKSGGTRISEVSASPPKGQKKGGKR